MCLGTHVPMCLTCSRANVPCVLTCSRANVPCALTGNLPCVLTYIKYQRVFFFEVKLIFCSSLYWDEQSLLIKVEARRVTRNASKLNKFLKILISQIHLGFIISVIINRCGSCQIHKKQPFTKLVNDLIPIYYLLKINHIRCLTVM